MVELDPPSVIISGASGGIGRACALHLDRLGFRVFAGVRHVAAGQALQQEASTRLQPLILNVTEPASIAAAEASVRQAVGPAGLSGLVNNAGMALNGPLEFLPLDDIRAEYEVNVLGSVAMIQAFLPLLRQGSGRIVNMGSVCGRVAVPFAGSYSASKFALVGLSDALRLELKPLGIHVALIEPGAISTAIWDKFFAAGQSLFDRLPEPARRLYEANFARQQQTLRQLGRFGLAPTKVALSVAHALTASQPRHRYLIGPEARAVDWLDRFVPDRLRDLLIPR
jgi:NAD(P)-dependent dehydrogenase (short-subunit alcohol dehydrogenase family)